MASEEGLYSRSGNTNPDGKCTERVDTLVPPELKERLQWMAMAQGITLGELSREIFESVVYGEFGRMQRIVQCKLRAGNGSKEG